MLLQAEYRQQDLDFAVLLADAMLERFEDNEQWRVFLHQSRPPNNLSSARNRRTTMPFPSGNGIAAFALQRLGHLLGETRYLQAARTNATSIRRYPEPQPRCLPQFVDVRCRNGWQPPTLVILRGDSAQLSAWAQHLAARFLPQCLVIALPNHITTGWAALDKPTAKTVNAWVCRGVECLPAIATLDELMMQLD